MPRSLKSYMGFFCPTSPVSSLLSPDDPEDYKHYTKDTVNMMRRYDSNTLDNNLGCAIGLVYGKHYHDLSEAWSDKTTFAKGYLDYLIFPLIARGLGDFIMILIRSEIPKSFEDTILGCLLHIIRLYALVISCVLVVALELARLAVGLPFILPMLIAISCARTYLESQLVAHHCIKQETKAVVASMSDFYSKYPDKNETATKLGQKLMATVELYFSHFIDMDRQHSSETLSTAMEEITTIKQEMHSLFKNTNGSSQIKKHLDKILHSIQTFIHKAQEDAERPEQVESWCLKWK